MNLYKTYIAPCKKTHYVLELGRPNPQPLPPSSTNIDIYIYIHTHTHYEKKKPLIGWLHGLSFGYFSIFSPTLLPWIENFPTQTMEGINIKPIPVVGFDCWVGTMLLA